jgi:hypothetical protein
MEPWHSFLNCVSKVCAGYHEGVIWYEKMCFPHDMIPIVHTRICYTWRQWYPKFHGLQKHFITRDISCLFLLKYVRNFYFFVSASNPLILFSLSWIVSDTFMVFSSYVKALLQRVIMTQHTNIAQTIACRYSAGVYRRQITARREKFFLDL